MLSRVELEQLFLLDPPASSTALAAAEHQYGKPLPTDYVAFVQVSNGLNTDGNLAILEVEGVVQRNIDYEVEVYLPGALLHEASEGRRSPFPA